MRGAREDQIRFWLPVVVLVFFAAYVSCVLIFAHLDPKIPAPKYDFERSIPARRGSIYGAYGKDSALVMSMPLWEYHLDPVALTNRVVRRRGEPPRPVAAILKTIADALDLDYKKVKRMAADTSRRYQFLARSSDPEAHRILADRSLVAGVAIQETLVRRYLCGRSLAHVLGSVNAEGVGSCGLELKYNTVLAGTPGVVRGKTDAVRRELYDKRDVSIAPKPGCDLYLTIEPNLQFEADAALKWGIREYGASAGWVVVMNASTGAILAMSSYPDFDPVSFGRAREQEKINRVVGYNFEPGSVMKVLTVATAIESDPSRFGPSTTYRTNRDDPDYYRLPGDGNHVWNPTMTLTEAIVKSSNIVCGKLAYDLGPLTLYDSFRRFGFGVETGVELPGEETGILPNPRRRMWDKASRSRAGIGQFVAVTPLQLVSAYQALANDGVRMRPYLVDRLTDASGQILYKATPTEVSRPVSAKTATTVRSMMRAVAAPGGTARRAAIRGYSIAGKTGTAQKAKNGHYQPGLYCASFCGIVPAERPSVVILASLDFDEKRPLHQGGNTAACVFKRVALAAIRYLGIAPDCPDELEASDAEDEFDKIVDEREAQML